MLNTTFITDILLSKNLYSLLLVFLMIGLSACTENQRRSEPHVDLVLVEHGIEVYRANYCGSCHTLTVANTRGMFGPNHDSIVEDVMSIIRSEAYVGEATTIEAYIYESIVEPAIFYTPGYEASNHHMPAFAHLPDGDVDAMVYMLINQDSIQESE